MKAVHFGAGNIGRGFIGAVLQDSGYHVVFADVNAELVADLNSAKSYQVIELGEGGQTRTYSDFEAVNSATERERLVQEIATADLVTSSVGANILPHIAELIAIGLEMRTAEKPAVVIACENAVNATDLLAAEILRYRQVQSKARFCNTAVDRIVPMQSDGLFPSVEVETFCEWVIETKNLKGLDFAIPGATMVEELSAYIERKLFTVNTAHCATAYLGQLAGYPTIASAMSDSHIYKQIEDVLEETSAALILKHGFSAMEHHNYVIKTLQRLSSSAIDDKVERVGRQPLRKLSRNERLVSPAAYLAENGRTPRALLSVIAAALVFQSDDDPEVAQLQKLLTTSTPTALTQDVCGIDPDHPLSIELQMVFTARQRKTLAS